MRPPNLAVYQYSLVRAIQKAETGGLPFTKGYHLPVYGQVVSMQQNTAMKAYYRPVFTGVNEKSSIV
jgi:hypothetical protein